MNRIRLAAVVVCFFIGMAASSLVCSAASCGETVSQSTEDVLKAVDYETDAEIAGLLSVNYTLTQITNKRLEIANRDGRKFLDVTEDGQLSRECRERLVPLSKESLTVPPEQRAKEQLSSLTK